MKYSVIMPYWRRPRLLARTLDSIAENSPGRVDFEVVIVEAPQNCADNRDHAELMDVIAASPVATASIVQDRRLDTICPGTAYNMGAEFAVGRFLVLTNPEARWTCDMLAGLDEEFDRDSGRYVVCACLGLKPDGQPEAWYQHSVHKDHKLNHFAAIGMGAYLKLGGFDESFSDGYARADIDFVWRVMNAGIPVVERDDLLVCHQWHPRTYSVPPDEVIRRMHLSAARLRAKWENVPIDYDQEWVKRVQEACW